MPLVTPFIYNAVIPITAYDTGKPESWKTLTSYLLEIANAGKFRTPKVGVFATFCITA